MVYGIKESPLGVISGKIGQVVGSNMERNPCVKRPCRQRLKPSDRQAIGSASEMSVTMHFLKPLSEFLQIGFKEYAVKMTGINAAMKYNIKNALTGTYPNIAIDYPNALVARGNLAGSLNAVASSTVAGTVAFNWDDNTGEIGASATDKTLLVIYNPVQNQAVTVNELAERADGTQTVTVPSSFSGDLVQCYMAFITESGRYPTAPSPER